MTEEQSREPSWFRRPREPLSGFLGHPQAWISAVILLPAMILIGPAVLIGETEWWERAGGMLVSLLGVAISVALVGYLRRPVDRSGALREHPVDRTRVDRWTDSLEREGYVEVGLSRGSVLRTFMALLPHLELATGRGPALRVDARGIQIARWTPLHIPWSEVLVVGVYAGTKRQRNFVVLVTEAFYERYQATRLFPLRVVDGLQASFTGTGFAIPSTIDASPESLAEWLVAEVQRRNPQHAS